MKVFKNVMELIGHTPLLALEVISSLENIQPCIYAKLEKYNPSGSSKDRIALYMLQKALEEGIITSNTTIIEPTSGNTGIGLSSLCSRMGLKAIIIMPDSMSVERIKLMKAFGAQVILTKGSLGMKGSIDYCNKLLKEIPDSFCPSQFDNPENLNAHYKTTGPEIYLDTDGKVDILVAGIGTGGTLCGSGKYLKEKNKNILVIGVEPMESPLITNHKVGPHLIQGIGANFVPKNFDSRYVDEVITVSSEDAYKYAQLMATKEGIFLGISSGASLAGAIQIAKRKENLNKRIVAIMPDGGEHYLSTPEFIKE